MYSLETPHRLNQCTMNLSLETPQRMVKTCIIAHSKIRYDVISFQTQRCQNGTYVKLGLPHMTNTPVVIGGLSWEFLFLGVKFCIPSVRLAVDLKLQVTFEAGLTCASEHCISCVGIFNIRPIPQCISITESGMNMKHIIISWGFPCHSQVNTGHSNSCSFPRLSVGCVHKVQLLLMRQAHVV